MPTRQKTSRVRVASSDRFVGLGVHAPSFVRTQSKAANQAAALSDALGFGLQQGTAAIKRRHDKAFLKGTEAFLEGRELTPQEQKNDAFVFGYKSSEHDRKMVEFKSAAETSYSTARNQEGFEFNAWYDGFAQEHFGDLDPESDLDREFIPRTTKLLSNHRAFLLNQEAKTVRAEVLDRTGENLFVKAQDTLNESGEFTAEQWAGLDREAFEVGGGQYAQEVALSIAKQFAAGGHVEALEAVPLRHPNGQPTFRTDTRLAGQYDALLAGARRQRRDGIEAASAAQIGQARAEITQIADQGGEDFPAIIEAAAQPNENGIAVFETPEQFASMWNRWFSARRQVALDPLSINAWVGGNVRAFDTADKETGSAKAAQAVAQQALANGATEADAQQAARLFTVERSVVNDYLPKWLKAELAVNPKSPNAFQNAVSLYDEFESQQPGFLAENLSDSFQVDLIQRYKRLLTENGGDAAAVFEIIGSVDKNLVQQADPSERRAARDDVIKQISELADDQASAGLFNFGSAEVSASTRNLKLASSEMDWYLSRGFSVDAAKAAAVAALDPVGGRYVQVDGELYRRNEGWGQTPEDIADFAREQYAEANDIDADDVQFVPIPNQPGQVWIKDRASVLAGGMTPVSIAGLSKAWRDSLSPAEVIDRTEAATEAQQRARASAIQQAKEELFPIRNISVRDSQTYQFALAARERAWNALTDQQRQRLIERSTN